MKYSFRYNLYWLYDRAFEDCEVVITAKVPEDWRKRCPKDDEIEWVSARLTDSTESFLTGTYRTNITRLLEDIEQDLRPRIAEIVTEDMGENQDVTWPEVASAYVPITQEIIDGQASIEQEGRTEQEQRADGGPSERTPT